MSKPKILIATTNKGKYEETTHAFDHVPFRFISLSEIDQEIPPPDETEDTITGNAILKAKYYGEKTGLLTLSDDTGLFIDALNGWPGVITARIGNTAEERMKKVLKKMKKVKKTDRTAQFRLALALYNPHDKNIHVTEGETQGEICETLDTTLTGGFGYDPIFFLPEQGKTYAELTLKEKNFLSHRGKAIYKMSHILQNEFGGRHLIVPIGIVIRDGKVLMNKRNDPHNAAFHHKWEFPGGGMDFGEKLEENLVREVREEAGYEVEVVRLLNTIEVFPIEKPNGERYQVYLMPYICKVIGGAGAYNQTEVVESRWFDPDDVLNHDLLSKNGMLYKSILPEVKEAARHM